MKKIETTHASAQINDFNHAEMTEAQCANIKYLSHVHVDKEHRRKGYATELMKTITKHADEVGIILLLEPKAFDDSDYTDLKPFYIKHGFKVIQTKPSTMMLREPKS